MVDVRQRINLLCRGIPFENVPVSPKDVSYHREQIRCILFALPWLRITIYAFHITSITYMRLRNIRVPVVAYNSNSTRW